MRAVGDIVVARPGTLWCSQDIGGRPLIVHEIHPYPDSVGGAVYIAHRPGTTPSSTADPHLQEAQMEKPVKVYAALLSMSSTARKLLGETQYNRQCEAVAVATSLSNFVRKIVASGLEQPGHGKDPYATLTRHIRTYDGGQPTNYPHDIAAATAHPDQVLIRLSHGGPTPHLAYPSPDHVLFSVAQPGSRTLEYLLLRVEDVEGNGQLQVRIAANGEFLGTIEAQNPDSPRPSYIARYPDYAAAHRICADRKDALRELLAYAEHYAGSEPEVLAP